jgi:hypothetical protein
MGCLVGRKFAMAIVALKHGESININAAVAEEYSSARKRQIELRAER